MKLELGKIYIKDIRFGDNTEIKNGTLIINKKELEELKLQKKALMQKLLTGEVRVKV